MIKVLFAFVAFLIPFQGFAWVRVGNAGVRFFTDADLIRATLQIEKDSSGALLLEIKAPPFKLREFKRKMENPVRYRYGSHDWANQRQLASGSLQYILVSKDQLEESIVGGEWDFVRDRIQFIRDALFGENDF